MNEGIQETLREIFKYCARGPIVLITKNNSDRGFLQMGVLDSFNDESLVIRMESDEGVINLNIHFEEISNIEEISAERLCFALNEARQNFERISSRKKT